MKKKKKTEGSKWGGSLGGERVLMVIFGFKVNKLLKKDKNENMMEMQTI